MEHVVELIRHRRYGIWKRPQSRPDKVQSTLIARATHEIYLQESLHYYGMMKSGYLAAGGYAFLRDYMDGLMKVTPQSIQNAAAQYLSAQMPVVTLMSPPVEKTAGETASRSPNQYSMEKAGKWPYRGNKGKPG